MLRLKIEEIENELSIALPPEVAEELKLKKGDKLSVQVEDGRMVLRPIDRQTPSYEPSS